ncbi:c-type cytochrome [Denitromonas iodatirespirans]|uniref:C-type cytochrome n=1 Tax=Denitromonas iodatirespirans TaxID=2795389 RepID=A0A944DEV7_DENI1|nr:c-type cytochrome [Denitromonas iodatirespirans]MBT0961533.1 c-type cytochrome [Denitromonas iodatirespirans]
MPTPCRPTILPLPPRLSACAIVLLSAYALLLPAPSQAADLAAPDVDTAGLAALSDPDTERNPYRGDARAIAIGREAFNQTCAVCHGADADAHRSPAPDLRRIGQSCRRVAEPALRLRCQTDADYYFRSTVEKGKIKLGIEHMPPWKGILSTELIWAIRSFVESAPRTSHP